MNTPKVKRVLGELVGFSFIETSDLYVLSLVTPDGKSTEASISKGYWESIKADQWIKQGEILNVEYEVRVKNQTGYTNSDGEEILHTSDGNSINRIHRGSATTYQRQLKDLEDGRKLEGKVNAAEKTLAMFMNVIGEDNVNQDAVANLLGKIMAA